MNRLVKRQGLAGMAAALIVLAVLAGYVYGHCQIPCGIYDDDARARMIAEHIATVEKSMKKIVELSAAKKKDHNQITRWVQNKEVHADGISEIVSYYFMAQRVKPADRADKEAYEAYVAQLTLLHKMLLASMKAKQTTDLEYITELRELLHQFQHVYKGFSHSH